MVGFEKDDIPKDDKKVSNGNSAKKSCVPGGRGGSKKGGQKGSKVHSLRVFHAGVLSVEVFGSRRNTGIFCVHNPPASSFGG